MNFFIEFTFAPASVFSGIKEIDNGNGMISAREWDNKIIDHGEGIRNTEEVLNLFDLASSDSRFFRFFEILYCWYNHPGRSHLHQPENPTSEPH